MPNAQNAPAMALDTIRRPFHRKSSDFLPLANDLLLIWDLVAGLSCAKLASVTALWALTPLSPDLPVVAAFWREVALGCLIACAMLRDKRLSTDKRLFTPARMLSILKWRAGATFALLLTVGLATRSPGDVTRAWLLLWALLFGLTVVLSRTFYLLYVRRLLARGALREAIAVVSLTGGSQQVASRLGLEADVVIHVVAPCPAARDPGSTERPLWRQSLGEILDTIMTLGRLREIDAVVVALGHDQHPDLSNIVAHLKSIPVQIAVCREQAWEEEARPFRMIGDLAVTILADRPLTAWNLVIKTFIDRVVALALLLFLSPLMLAILVAILIDDPGPPVFRQRRSGWCGETFILNKFRTMRVSRCDEMKQAARGDVRLTRTGSFLRKTSLDELPQLLNVILGDMSVVGPRPHVDFLHAHDIAAQAIVAEYAQRYRMKPGMTGWAQVNGLRGATCSSEQLRQRVEYDLFYIENWSLLFDFWIMALTPIALLSRENAF